jgi:DNA-binding HxlR family transcriptional regulator
MVKQNIGRKRRSSCPISCSLDLLGDAWTLLVVRDVLFRQRHKFSEIASEEVIASNILTDRLAKLEREGLVVRHRDPSDGRKKVIKGTQKALALTPILMELASFGDATSGSGSVGLSEYAARYREDPEGFIQEVEQAQMGS